MGKSRKFHEPIRRLAQEFLSVIDLGKIPPVTWLVKALIPSRAVAMVYGPSGGGKTFWVLDLLLRISTGIGWNGQNTRQGLTLMLAGEGAAGLKNRVDAFFKHHNLDPAKASFALLPRMIDLSDKRQVWMLIVAARFLAMRARQSLLAICIDTFARATSTVDENSNQAMSLIMEHCALITRWTRATVILVHHTGHNSDRARGASAIRAALDTEIFVSPVQKTDCIGVEVTKQKDAEAAKTMHFQLVPVHLGIDPDGDPIVSMVAEQCVAPQQRTSQSDRGLAVQIAALTVLAANPQGLRDTKWRAAAESACGKLSKESWYRARDFLVRGDKVVKKNFEFFITAAGMSAIGTQDESTDIAA